MSPAWTLVRFLHVVGAIIWVGGQLTVTVIVLPPAAKLLAIPDRAQLLRSVGRRFALVTAVVFLPLQISTGVLLAMRRGITWADLLHAGEGRVLLTKLVLFTAVMTAATVHGMLQARGRRTAARAASTAALVGSVGVVLLGVWLAEGVG
jgi:uncharacterized membrane protein